MTVEAVADIKKKFKRCAFANAKGQELEYYLYLSNPAQIDRVIVYLHGLVSDIYWFRIPPNLPENTGILFLPRQPRTDVDTYASWTENYEACLNDFKNRHPTPYIHLVAQCFGTQLGLHWSTVKPDHFTTLTFASPPVEVRDDYSLKSKLKIMFGGQHDRQTALLTPRHYARNPCVTSWIKQNPTTTYEFSNHFFAQTAFLRAWLKKNSIHFSSPTHLIFTSEDAVVKLEKVKLHEKMPRLPDQVTYLTADHFVEMLPQKDKFWEALLGFQKENEMNYELEGKIQTVLVTGATGFLGSHIVRKLHAEGLRVMAFVRDSESAKKKFTDLTERMEFRKGSLSDLEGIEQACQDVDAIVHTAGHVREWDTYENFEETNVEGTKNILMIAHAQGIKQFIHISSLGVFGDTDQDHISENNPYVLSSDFYSNSKIHAEIFVKKYCRENRLPFGIIRPGFIYGEGDNHFFPNLIRNLKAGKVKYVGSKKNIVNAVYVGNVSALVSKLIGNHETFGEAYNISDPTDTEIGDLLTRVCHGLNLEPPTKVIPKGVAVAIATLFETIYRTFKIKTAPPLSRKKLTFAGRSRSVNATKAYRLIGKEPFSFDEGMAQTLNALKK